MSGLPAWGLQDRPATRLFLQSRRPPPVPRFDRVLIRPQPEPLGLGLECGPLVFFPCPGRFFHLGRPIPPSHPGAQLLETQIQAIDPYHAGLLELAVGSAFRRRLPVEGQGSEIRFGPLSEGLGLFGGIDPGNPNPVLPPGSIQQGNRIAVDDADDTALDDLWRTFWNCRHLPRPSGRRRSQEGSAGRKLRRLGIAGAVPENGLPSLGTAVKLPMG